MNKNIEVVILCGGKGTRLSEETILKPKPLVEIGGRPILWHIMKCFSYYGYSKFVLALGYKGNLIKEFFYNYRNTSSDFSLSLNPEGGINYFNKSDESNWEVSFIDTGQETLKGGRIKKLEKYIKSNEFFLTYGDGVSNININELYKFHSSHNKLGTVSAVRPPSRFGELNLDSKGLVLNLEEKPQMHKGLINGGFFVFNKKIMSYLKDSDDCDFEFGPLQEISEAKNLMAYNHNGFWQCMDNIRERNYLDKLIKTKSAPWVKWE